MSSVLGHAEKMIHDLKHEFRLQVANTFDHPLHQVTISNNYSLKLLHINRLLEFISLLSLHNLRCL